MAITFDKTNDTWSSIEELKKLVKALGYFTKVILDDITMEKASELIRKGKKYYSTPDNELRYMEGLLNLPLGFIVEFGVVHAKDHEKCYCGRTPSALDVVVTALKNGIHGRDLIRDAVIGMENIFEIAEEGGRKAQCINCGKIVVVERYNHKKSYMYA